MIARCFYPGCILDEHEQGDHRIGRPETPRGVLTVVSEFRVTNSPIPCDLQPAEQPRSHAPALGFFVDELRFGWQLCYACVQEYQLHWPQMPKSDNVVEFRKPRAKGQRLKAGPA